MSKSSRCVRAMIIKVRQKEDACFVHRTERAPSSRQTSRRSCRVDFKCPRKDGFLIVEKCVSALAMSVFHLLVTSCLLNNVLSIYIKALGVSRRHNAPAVADRAITRARDRLLRSRPCSLEWISERARSLSLPVLPSSVSCIPAEPPHSRTSLWH